MFGSDKRIKPMIKLEEKIDFLQTNHLSEWLKTRSEVQEEISNRQSMFCVCKRLASGFHEMNCRKFHQVVTNETAKRLYPQFQK